ncbi:NUDIX hydrolase [Candidatus Kaiserbacteria bacterium]|nr:NUDIX hydrolase [Candidatus Kaiserbacteria bacterium]
MSMCDHTSVGIFVWKDGKLLLIERGMRPWGFAVPAGHVDGDATFEEAATRELKEEVGLDAPELTLLAEGRKENQCRRTNGTWHYWKLYEAKTTGEIKRSVDETKRAGWYSKEYVGELARRTEAYENGRISEPEWERGPGLEPVMYEWFKELRII